MNTPPLFIQLIADYGVGDPAFSEVIQKILHLDPTVRVHPTSVPKFSTIATGFWTAQFSAIHPVENMIIYTNTAPRKDNKAVRENNEGEGLVYAKLKNGLQVVGVNAGYCFSFIKPFIDKLYVVNVANKGSQFRSRDFYPDAVIGIATGKAEYIGHELAISVIPDAPINHIAFIDGYGNMKTTTRLSQVMFKPGDVLTIELNHVKRTAYFTDGTFSVREGELAFAPGSTGGDDKFMEIFLRGLSAWHEFVRPEIEAEFQVYKSD